MIEGIHSSLAASSVGRGNAQQTNSSAVFASSLDSGTVAQAPQAPYISPYISVDINHNKAVIQIRDSDTGEVKRQIPSESQLEAYTRTQREQTTPDEATKEIIQAASPRADEIRESSSAPAPQTVDITVEASAPAPAESTDTFTTDA